MRSGWRRRDQAGRACQPVADDRGFAGQIAELMAARYAELQIQVVQVRGHGAQERNSRCRRSRHWSGRGWRAARSGVVRGEPSQDVRCGADGRRRSTGQARSSASARRVQGTAPTRRNVSSAAARTGLASLIRRCRRSHFAIVQPQLGPLEQPPCRPGRTAPCQSRPRLQRARRAGRGRVRRAARTARGVPGPTGPAPFHQDPCLKATLRPQRRGSQVSDAQVGDVVVQRRAIGTEEAAELAVGAQVAALGQRREARGVPRPWRRTRGTRPGRGRPARGPAATVPGPGRRAWPARSRCPGRPRRRRSPSCRRRLCRRPQGRSQALHPIVTVDAGPLQRRQCATATRAHARSAQPAECVPHQPDREFGLVQQPGRRADRAGWSSTIRSATRCRRGMVSALFPNGSMDA